jgi:hypothetical protein
MSECQKHSVKAGKHSAKCLTSVTLSEVHSVNEVSANGSSTSVKRRALDKRTPSVGLDSRQTIAYRRHTHSTRQVSRKAKVLCNLNEGVC